MSAAKPDHDLLAIAAHPDDADLGIGGTLCKAVRAGQRVAMLDLTRGEMSTRGTVEERAAEAAAAAKVLGIESRSNAGLPDGNLANTAEQRLEVIRHIRALRPRILLAPMTPDRHPDHEAAHELVKAANFFAGLTKIDTRQEPYRAPTVYYYYSYFPGPAPAVIVDISDTFDTKVEALREFKSQFHHPGGSGGPETYISTEGFWEQIQVRAAFWGAQAGVRYGEPLHHFGPLKVDLPLPT